VIVTTSKLMDGLQRSWLIKLAWVWTPMAVPLVVALSNNGPGHFAPWLAVAASLLLFGGLAASYGLALVERRQQRDRIRHLPTLQRLQVSDETNLAPLSEVLRTGDYPPFETLPAPLQKAIICGGAPLPKPAGGIVDTLMVGVWILFVLMAFLHDPTGLLARHMGAPYLPYWDVFLPLIAIVSILLLRSGLRRMHDHYVAEAKTTGRRPFADR